MPVAEAGNAWNGNGDEIAVCGVERIALRGFEARKGAFETCGEFLKQIPRDAEFAVESLSGCFALQISIGGPFGPIDA